MTAGAIKIKEKAALVGWSPKRGPKREADESLDELEQLADTAGAEVVFRVVQEREKPAPATFIGRGKLKSLGEFVSEKEIDLVIFDDDLTPVQQRNVEDIVRTKVVDRTGLILDIFAQRARTREGKLQVELAQMEYLLPRLVGKGTLLSRLGGGIGTRGPGEMKLEIDRRRIREKISHIKKDLEAIRKHRRLYRAKRQSVPVPVAALVGYTNSGKSTLLNSLTNAGVFCENRLFATLDPTTRRIELPNGRRVLLSDTVGFIRKLPHQLVEAFKATLEEVSEADLLLHIIDASHSDWMEQAEAVDKILAELELAEKDIICVYNKIDRFKNKNRVKILLRQKPGSVAISALRGEGIGGLLEAVEQKTANNVLDVTLSIPHKNQSVLSQIHELGKVTHTRYLDDRIEVKARLSYQPLARLEKNSLLGDIKIIRGQPGKTRQTHTPAVNNNT
jgi:GTP-binding protein HflX